MSSQRIVKREFTLTCQQAASAHDFKVRLPYRLPGLRRVHLNWITLWNTDAADTGIIMIEIHPLVPIGDGVCGIDASGNVITGHGKNMLVVPTNGATAGALVSYFPDAENGELEVDSGSFDGNFHVRSYAVDGGNASMSWININLTFEYDISKR